MMARRRKVQVQPAQTAAEFFGRGAAGVGILVPFERPAPQPSEVERYISEVEKWLEERKRTVYPAELKAEMQAFTNEYNQAVNYANQLGFFQEALAVPELARKLWSVYNRLREFAIGRRNAIIKRARYLRLPEPQLPPFPPLVKVPFRTGIEQWRIGELRRR